MSKRKYVYDEMMLLGRVMTMRSASNLFCSENVTRSLKMLPGDWHFLTQKVYCKTKGSAQLAIYLLFHSFNTCLLWAKGGLESLQRRENAA